MKHLSINHLSGQRQDAASLLRLTEKEEWKTFTKWLSGQKEEIMQQLVDSADEKQMLRLQGEARILKDLLDFQEDMNILIGNMIANEQ